MILLSYTSAEAYVSRYAEPDKAGAAPDLGVDAARLAGPVLDR